MTDDDDGLSRSGYNHVWQVGDVAEGLYNDDRFIRYPQEYKNRAGLPEYRPVEAELIEKLLARLVRITHFTHIEETVKVQRVQV